MNLTACFDKEVVPAMWSEQMESGHLKIVSVGALDGDSFGITLESGHTILLELDGKWYYFNADGSLAKNTKIDGHEVDENGVRKSK